MAARLSPTPYPSPQAIVRGRQPESNERPSQVADWMDSPSILNPVDTGSACGLLTFCRPKECSGESTAQKSKDQPQVSQQPLFYLILF